eukprot:scaffold7320_cov139-Isochrysis_galbana.AAC.6
MTSALRAEGTHDECVSNNARRASAGGYSRAGRTKRARALPRCVSGQDAQERCKLFLRRRLDDVATVVREIEKRPCTMCRASRSVRGVEHLREPSVRGDRRGGGDEATPPSGSVPSPD